MKRFLMLSLLYLCSSGLGVTGKVADDSSGARISIVIASLAPLVTPFESGFMLIGAAELAALPTSGSAYMWMRGLADYSIANSPTKGTPTSESPWLANYAPGFGSYPGVGKGAEALACALVYARTPSLTQYKTHVENMCRYIIGTEDGPSTNGTPENARTLSVIRAIPGFVMAANLVGMSSKVTGSRAGWTTKVWNTWLGELRSKTLYPGVPQRSSIIATNISAATNWGAAASLARIAIDIYVNDQSDLDSAIARLKLYVGESYSGTAWAKSSAYDPSWAYLPAGLPVSFVPINPDDGNGYTGKNGLIVEDASRSAFAYPTFDEAGIRYSLGALGFQLTAARLLYRAGYTEVWNWGNAALKRAFAAMDARGYGTGDVRVYHRWLGWLVNKVYNTTYATHASGAGAGESMGFSDWLFPPT